MFFLLVKKDVKLKIFDLRCDKYLQNTVLVLVLRDEDSGREILLPISDYEFRYIKNLVLRKESFSYIDSLGKNFFFTKNELIIQDDEIKSRLTFCTTDNFTQEVILPPIEALLYCADKKINIFVEEETFEEIQKLDFKARQNFSENVENVENFNIGEKQNQEKTLFFKDPTTEVADLKNNFVDFRNNANILDVTNIGEECNEEFINVKITEENIKEFSSENLLENLKFCLSEYLYEDAMLIHKELKNRNVDFRHELCEEDFL